LCRIGYRDATTGKFYEFLTNNFQLAAATIAAIYKDRWQVELFFKAIKQNPKIHAFVGASKNEVITQIWIAMTAFYCWHLLATAKVGWNVQRICG
jgi:putative transposase